MQRAEIKSVNGYNAARTRTGNQIHITTGNQPVCSNGNRTIRTIPVNAKITCEKCVNVRYLQAAIKELNSNYA